MEKQEEEKEQQKEHVDSLDKDEIPPDTQVNNDQMKITEKEENQNEAKEENQANEQAQEEAAKQVEENNEEEEHGEEVQGEEGQKYQIIEDEERGRLYQYVQNGKIYQVDERGQLYQVIQEGQEEQDGQEGQEAQEEQKAQEEQEEQIERQQQQYQLSQNQVFQYNQGGQAFQAQQQYQIIQQGEGGHQYQVVPQNQMYQMNQNQGNYSMANQQNYQSLMQNENRQSNNYQMVKENNASYIANDQKNMKSGNMGSKVQDRAKRVEKSNRSKINMQRKNKRTEPRDSNPKVYLVFNNKGEKEKSYNYNRSGFKNDNKNFRMNNARDNRSFQKLTFEINSNEKRYMRDSQNHQNFSNKTLENFSQYDRINLYKNKNEFVEIPRKDYDKYSLRDTITVGYGMDTGEYKFVGAKTLIKENTLQKGNKSVLSEEEVLKEINRRNVKKEKKKKVSYEIIDKFYALTEMGGKTIKRIEKNSKKEYSKNDFYSSLRNSSNYNQNNNRCNDDFIIVENNDSGNKSYNYNNYNNNSGYGNYNNKNASSQFNQNNNMDSNRSRSQLNYKLYGFKEMSSKSGMRSNNKIINNFSSNNYATNNYSSNKYASKNNTDSYFSTTNYQNRNNNYNNNYSNNNKYLGNGNYNSSNNYSSNKYSGNNYSSNNNGGNKYSSSSKNYGGNKYSRSSNNYGGNKYSSSSNNYNNYSSNNYSNNNNNNYEMGEDNEGAGSGAGAYLNGPLDNYSKYLIDQINTIRADPQSFIGVIEDSKANICKDKKGRLIFNGKVKIALNEGESAFNECIEYLKNLEPMEPLEFDPYLTIQPPQSEQEIKDKNDIHKKVDDMISNGVYISSYWRDFIKDPEISFLLMIVDDNGVNKGRKRNDILNPSMKYIGISSAEIKRNFVSYIALR